MKINLKLFNFILGALVTIISSLVINLIWINNFSGACLNIQTTPYRDILIALNDSRESIDFRLQALKTKLKGQRAKVFLYDSSFTNKFLLTSDNLEDLSNRFQPINSDVIFEEQLDAHKYNRCFTADVTKIRDGIFKTKMKENNLYLSVSCPLINSNNFVIGYIEIGYQVNQYPYPVQYIQDQMSLESYAIQNLIELF